MSLHSSFVSYLGCKHSQVVIDCVCTDVVRFLNGLCVNNILHLIDMLYPCFWYIDVTSHLIMVPFVPRVGFCLLRLQILFTIGVICLVRSYESFETRSFYIRYRYTSKTFLHTFHAAIQAVGFFCSLLFLIDVPFL